MRAVISPMIETAISGGDTAPIDLGEGKDVRVRAFAPGPLGAAHGATAAGWERLRPALRDLKRRLGR